MKPGPRRSRRQYEARARIAQALAHPSRLLLLEALREKEACVSDLTHLVGADQSTVSKHLAMLRSVGLVEMREVGSMNYYRACCACLDGFFDCIENVIRQNLQAHQRAAAGG